MHEGPDEIPTLRMPGVTPPQPPPPYGTSPSGPVRYGPTPRGPAPQTPFGSQASPSAPVPSSFSPPVSAPVSLPAPNAAPKRLRADAASPPPSAPDGHRTDRIRFYAFFQRYPLFVLAGGLVGLAVVLVAVLGALLVLSNRQVAKASSAAQAYCADLRAQHYSDAFALLSSSARATTTAPVYALTAADADAIDGKVTACAIPTPGFAFHINLDPSTAVLPATITRQRTRTGTIRLIHTSGAWHVDQLSQSLRGTDVGPIVVAQQYCQALAKGDYAAAYAATSPAYQARAGSASAYATSIKNALGQAQATISGCQMQMSTYRVSPTDTVASLQWALVIRVGSLDTPTTQMVTLRKDGAVWKIDSIG